MFKIAIIGPECTGKTTLAMQLAEKYQSPWVPEYARAYVESLHRNYTFEDVENIAKQQYEQIKNCISQSQKFVFFDTDLIITKIWFQVVFRRIPSWIEDAIHTSKMDLYLLCNTDIRWEPDEVRENGGLMREKLFQMYKKELLIHQSLFFEVSGIGENRTNAAISFIDNHF